MTAADEATTILPAADPAPINSDEIKTEPLIDPVVLPGPPTTNHLIGWVLYAAIIAALVWLALQDRGYKSDDADDDPELIPEVGR